MRNLMLGTIAATFALALGAGGAAAFERNITVHTDRGTINKSVERFCFDGRCYREAEITGVNGNTLRRSGMCVNVGYGDWSCKGTVTGPDGNSRTRWVDIYRY